MTTKETPNAEALRELLEGVVGRALKPGSTVESVLDEQRERHGISAEEARQIVANSGAYSEHTYRAALRRLDPDADPR